MTIERMVDVSISVLLLILVYVKLGKHNLDWFSLFYLLVLTNIVFNIVVTIWMSNKSIMSVETVNTISRVLKWLGIFTAFYYAYRGWIE